MKPRLLLLPALLLLPLSACVIHIGDWQSVQVEREETFTWEGSARTVVVRTCNGRVDVTPGGPTVEGRVRFRASGGDLDEARERLQDLWLDQRLEGDRLVLEVRGRSGRGCRHGGASIELRLPPGMNLDAATSNGSVRASVGEAEEVVLASSNGRLELQGLPAAFELRTSNGSVRVELTGDWAGRGRVHTSNGPIRVLCRGRLESTVSARTSNGRVEVAGTRPIRLLGEAPPAPAPHLALRTSNGSITIRQED